MRLWMGSISSFANPSLGFLAARSSLYWRGIPTPTNPPPDTSTTTTPAYNHRTQPLSLPMPKMTALPTQVHDGMQIGGSLKWV